MNQSDLEDYAHLEIQIPLLATNGNGSLSLGWSATIQYLASSGTPSVDLYALPATYATSLLTYMNDPTAAAALGGSPDRLNENPPKFLGERASGTADGDIRGLNVVPGTETPNPEGTNGYLNFLFDGVTAGSGEIVVRWAYNGQLVVQNGFHLQLQTITQMYEQASVEYQWVDTATDSVTLGDLRAQPQDAPTIPTTAQTYNEYAPSSMLDNQVIVFVHGWRMKPSEQESYADTAFKRLYWQGYTGRFVSFMWPTQWVDTVNKLNTLADPGNYDESEQKAWNSAPALYNLLVSLDQQYGYQNVDIFAHSMGNVVTSEALRIAATQPSPVPVVNAYIAMQAAIPAEAYEPYNPNGSLDEYNDFMGSGSSYFSSLSIAAPKMYNFYNPDDIAVGNGVADAWNINNGNKPNAGYHADIPQQLLREASVRFGAGIAFNMSVPAQRYEAFAYAAYSKTSPLGGTANAGGPFNWGGLVHEVDLNAQFGFTTDHSGEFDGTEQWRSPFWVRVMASFNLNHW
jgi:pimeloyl-ACP methyl ester carboxylesterase